MNMTTPSKDCDSGGEAAFFESLAQKAQAFYGAAYTPRGRGRLFEAAAARRAKLSLSSISDYQSLLRRDPAEWAKLWPLALADEDGAFFKPQAQFEVAAEVLAEWSVMAPERTLRVLSLGFGRAHETVSLAVMLEESGLRGKNWQVEIFGLELNEEAVGFARNGIYDEADLDWLTEARRKKWFTPRAGGWSFKRELAPPTLLAAGNAYDPASWPFAAAAGGFDLIFCRGLTLEAPPDAPEKLARLLREVMAPHGFIFTAPGEFLPDSSGELALEERAGVVYYRRDPGPRVKANVHHTPKKRRGGAAAALAPLPPLSPRERSLLAAANQALAGPNPEEAGNLLREAVISAAERGRPAPEAWALCARAEEALGRPASARAAREAAEAFAR
ncbi:MAG: hypothetical protein LBS31_08920 [Candidatus Adiutrix sp.]|jgi:chemotaxis methyl-accepting protein methylase|nr:hypothetical protein [Candidatus Adiutrix sp.]